jgi:23S rRNA (adenine2503-C2)-methyltransferase
MAAEVGSRPSAEGKLDFFGLTPPEFDAAVADWGWPKFRGKQVRDWIYAKLVADPAQMTNLSPRDSEMLRERVSFGTADITREQLSTDGTIKLLLTWNEPGAPAPGATASRVASAETVMIPDADRRTACVSSQVGCPVGCHFCASGIGGVKGNLSAAQIVEQVYRLNLRMKDEGARMKGGGGAPVAPQAITNVVFMGMGEPLANYANVMQAIRILHDPQCFNLGARRITISTVGVPSRMRDLAREDLPLNLAISLHAPNEALRRQLIPWAEHFALDDILGAARYYFDRTGREITLEYILLSGVNDRPEHARELARLCKTLRANVNLIRYNEVAGLPYQRPKSEDVVAFQNILRNNGVNAHVRKSRGRDIDAACGQLRRKQEQEGRQQPLVTLSVGQGTGRGQPEMMQEKTPLGFPRG